MELILIRHALPERRRVSDGAADPELSPEGHAQAEHMADYLSTEHIDAVYTSPMRRAAQTAAPLGRRLGLEPVVVDDVAEWERNASEYVPIEHRIAASRSGVRSVVTINETSHLRNTGLPMGLFQKGWSP